jgi:hypothetical protein
MSKKIIKYKIIIHNSIPDLETDVSYYIGKYWQPFGAPLVSGVIMHTDRYFSHNYCQTMVKYEEYDPSEGEI